MAIHNNLNLMVPNLIVGPLQHIPEQCQDQVESDANLQAVNLHDEYHKLQHQF
jgi:hypothetical protein